ncbi:MAG: hypothetical protein UR99_C0017G0039 [Candidatus Moranbacteria bacterium GW2011_GWD2_36_12]|nr:MAG: hypothetical protein UR99_C0017G0039 [Candidatus Moranbacteria bacterium GW2011_GWD2_36_12]
MPNEIKPPVAPLFDECKVLIDKDRNLFVMNKHTGESFRITVFDGGGYYSALWLRTEGEIQESDNFRKNQEQKELADLKDRQQEKKKSFFKKLFE